MQHRPNIKAPPRPSTLRHDYPWMCQAKHPEHGYQCRGKANHDGDHKYWDAWRKMSTWPNERPADAPLAAGAGGRPKGDNTNT